MRESLFICSKYNIQFTEEEYDAMKILDRDDDKQIHLLLDWQN